MKEIITIDNQYPEGSVDWYLFKNLNQKFDLYEEYRGKINEKYDWTLGKMCGYHQISKCTNCIEDTRRWQNLSVEEREEVKKKINRYDGDKSDVRFKFICSKYCLWWNWFQKIRDEFKID